MAGPQPEQNLGRFWVDESGRTVLSSVHIDGLGFLFSGLRGVVGVPFVTKVIAKIPGMKLSLGRHQI